MSSSASPAAQPSASGSSASRTLDDVMREPSTTVPDVVVLDVVHVEDKPKLFIDPKKDLWLSTVNGRHQSRIIPVRVGPHAETFPVHSDILRKAIYFRKALDGDFKEGEDQAIDLPEEDPAVFSFVIAYLYEEKYQPIQPAAEALIVEAAKGKGKEGDEDANASGSDSASDSLSSGSDDTARSRRRADARRRRQQRAWDQRNRKEPGRHRPDCNCNACVTEIRGPPCWNCGMPRNRPPPPPNRNQRWYPNMPPPPPGLPPGVIVGRNGPLRPPNHRHRRRGSQDRNTEEIVTEPRMTAEDLRTWLMAYELSVEVYVCAERYLMNDFKACVAIYITENFEIAGMDAAQPTVLFCCRKLYDGIPSSDILLRKVFARVGFLLARLWKNFPEETHNFFMENPEVGGLIMKETMDRREEDAGDELPAMERMYEPEPGREEMIIHERRHYR